MNIKVIKSEQDYQEALLRIDDIFNATPNTPEGDELDLLVTLVEIYEKNCFKIDAPDPVSAIKFRMEQLGLENNDLIQYLGSRFKVSEILNGKRSLSLNMIRKLSVGLNIPLEVLIQPCKKA